MGGHVDTQGERGDGRLIIDVQEHLNLLMVCVAIVGFANINRAEVYGEPKQRVVHHPRVFSEHRTNATMCVDQTSRFGGAQFLIKE